LEVLVDGIGHVGARNIHEQRWPSDALAEQYLDDPVGHTV
jgi:hypothetical protein